MVFMKPLIIQSHVTTRSERALVAFIYGASSRNEFFSIFLSICTINPCNIVLLHDPLFQATLLLLQERIPKPTASYLQELPKSQM